MIKNRFQDKIPEYYPTMYLDGYAPYQILTAAHKKLQKEYEKENKPMEQEKEDKPIEIHITCEVKKK